MARLLGARVLEVCRLRRLREDIVQEIKKLSHAVLLLRVLQPLRELEAPGVVVVELSRGRGGGVGISLCCIRRASVISGCSTHSQHCREALRLT